MTARILHADNNAIKSAAAAIKAGGLVAFPTETVYGLAADIFNEHACKKIFEVKCRPADKPLTAHVSDKTQISRLAERISAKAEKLIAAFMPGPLTLVLFKRPLINDIVSGGTNTVGVRMPDHKTALAFISSCGGALAGTSANISNCAAPVSAQEVLDSLGDKVPFILDGGTCALGAASTVVDMTAEPPAILREGSLSRQKIEEVIGKVK